MSELHCQLCDHGIFVLRNNILWCAVCGTPAPDSDPEEGTRKYRRLEAWCEDPDLDLRRS